MPDPHRIEGELVGFYSKPQYSSRFYNYNLFKKDTANIQTPKTIAHETVKKLLSEQPFLDPVYVEELRGPLEFYRAFEGLSIKNRTAMTLGQYWSSSDATSKIWQTTAALSGVTRREAFLEAFRAANFISPVNNSMKHIACMHVPAGNNLVAIHGRGNWAAMRTKMPTSLQRPGEEQYLIPLFNDAWICKIEELSSNWPLA